MQTDAKVIIGGAFSTVNGTGRNFVARLNPNGSVDNSFDPGPGPQAEVYSLAVQTDGKIVIAGYFVVVDGVQP
jgi:hypothetical protein